MLVAQTDVYVHVEATRADQRCIQHLHAEVAMVDDWDKHCLLLAHADLNHVGRRDDNDVIVALEAIHCCQELPAHEGKDESTTRLGRT